MRQRSVRWYRLFIRTAIVTLFLAPSVASALPAFPGAQGGGASSVGGRGGRVIVVTNLDDSGTGSLRACVLASGPRTCVFRVAGTIQLQSQLYISNPYLTVAGQTAPGGGILLSGKNSVEGLVTIVANDVIWQYTRLRHGYHPVYLHTNLARETFPPFDVGQLYRLRWQVELLFKEWKSHANLHGFDTSMPAIAPGIDLGQPRRSDPQACNHPHRRADLRHRTVHPTDL